MLGGLVFLYSNPPVEAIVAERLRRLTRNQIPSGSTGSNPVDCETFYEPTTTNNELNYNKKWPAMVSRIETFQILFNFFRLFPLQASSSSRQSVICLNIFGGVVHDSNFSANNIGFSSTQNEFIAFLRRKL